MRYFRGSLVAYIVLVLWLVGCIGWVMNILNIIAHISEPITMMLVLQCIGVVVAPLGAVLGWVIW